MLRRGGFKFTLRILTVLADIAVFLGSFYLSYYVRYGRVFPDYNFRPFAESFGYIVLFFMLVNVWSGLYVYYNKRLSDFLVSTFINQFITSIFVMALTFAGRWFAFPRSVILLNLFVSTLFLFIERWGIFEVYRRFGGSKKVMIIGDREKVFAAVDNFQNSHSVRHVVTHVVLNRYYEHVVNELENVDIVYMASQIQEEERLSIIEYVMRKRKKVFVNTSYKNLAMLSPNLLSIEDESMIELSLFEIPQEMEVVKRLVDIIVSLIILLIASPIMLVTAYLIKKDGGPIFYKQVRITKGGKEFNILKFRSMSVTAEAESGPVLAASNDSRVTKVGEYIRAMRIDELPQLINVLKGDMSLVGPRPERPFFVEQFQQENPYYYLRHNVRAGITGYAQVYGKYASNFNRKLNFDLIYIKKYTPILDLKIMLQTIKILFDKLSSRGVEEQLPHVYTESELAELAIQVFK